MEIETHIRATRTRLHGWRQAGERIVLVPTMGNLHAGHLALMARARELGERVVATIFVNPLQFGPNEDFSAYPRTPAEDQAGLREAGVDLLFAPAVTEIYPAGEGGSCRVEVPGLAEILCGASRPGHFSGVATVVAKLFNIVQPAVAVFGEKDFQQLLVIRRLAAGLCFPVDIVGVPTLREPDGLAMSSRNAYLTLAERARAPMLYRTLREAARDLAAGGTLEAVEQAALESLRAAGFRPDYLEVRRASDLSRAGADDPDRVILAAAWLGKARLIDNLRLGAPGSAEA